jgi:hypothetical protein
MFCNFSGMFSLPDYARAKAHFEETPWPATKRDDRHLWEVDQRPLDGKRKWHVRIAKAMRDGQETYSLCLYHTEMVRYYPPGDDGFARVLIQHDSRNASSQFMWRSGWSTRAVRRVDTGGNDIVVPLGHAARRVSYNYDNWAADLYVKGETVDTERSWHAPIARRVTSPECRQERRSILKPVEHILRFASEAYEKGYYHPHVYMSEYTAHSAIEGDTDAQAKLMEWALAQNTAALRDIKNALLNVLDLRTLDETAHIPQFPTVDAWSQINPKKIVSQ